jgi:O-6-methylguanine DNA methyltransferase
VITYAELARRAGRPRSARAAANACGANPLPVIIPCHRVVRSDGDLGGYSGAGGVSSKRELLRREGCVLRI